MHLFADSYNALFSAYGANLIFAVLSVNACFALLSCNSIFSILSVVSHAFDPWVFGFDYILLLRRPYMVLTNVFHIAMHRILECPSCPWTHLWLSDVFLTHLKSVSRRINEYSNLQKWFLELYCTKCSWSYQCAFSFGIVEGQWSHWCAIQYFLG